MHTHGDFLGAKRSSMGFSHVSLTLQKKNAPNFSQHQEKFDEFF